MSKHKAILEFDLQDSNAREEFYFAINGKKYWLALNNIRNELSRVLNDKDTSIEGRFNLISDALKHSGLNDNQIAHVLDMISELKDSLCETYIDIINSCNIDDI